MKHFKSTVFGVLILFVAFSSSSQSKESNNSEGFAEVQISTPKREYLLGEPVTIARRFTKTGDVQVDYPWDDRGGRLKVFIAKNGGEFQFYTFTGSYPP